MIQKTAMYGVLIIPLLSTCTLFKIIYYNDSGITDYRLFPFRVIRASKSPFNFISPSSHSRKPDRVSYADKKNVPLAMGKL